MATVVFLSPSHSPSFPLPSPSPSPSIASFPPSTINRPPLTPFFPLLSLPPSSSLSYPKHTEESKNREKYSTAPNHREESKSKERDDAASKQGEKLKERERDGGEIKVISSVSNPFVKHCVKLRLSASYRRSTNCVLIVGLTPILEICKFETEKNSSSSLPISQLILLEGTDVSSQLQTLSNSVMHVSPNVMKKLSGFQSADSTRAVAVVRKPQSFCEAMESKDDFVGKLIAKVNRVLVLDGIQDPGNLGTLIRSARAFNWDGIFLINNCCDPFNEKALRSARGASFQIPIISTSLPLFQNFVLLHNLKTLAGHPANSPKQTQSLTRDFVEGLRNERLCLVLGSEGNGLSNGVLERCELVSISMDGGFESLNVSVAGGIFLYMLQNGCRL